jgi:hypothetical protein
MLGWDKRWVYLEHRIATPSGKPVAIALARPAFRKKAARVPIERLIEALPHELAAMPLPPQVTAWTALDGELAALVEAAAP